MAFQYVQSSRNTRKARGKVRHFCSGAFNNAEVFTSLQQHTTETTQNQTNEVPAELVTMAKFTLIDNCHDKNWLKRHYSVWDLRGSHRQCKCGLVGRYHRFGGTYCLYLQP
jgi:hypothetical protein